MPRLADLIASMLKQATAIKTLADVARPSAKQRASLKTNAGSLETQAKEAAAIVAATPTAPSGPETPAPPDYPDRDKRRSSVVFAEWFDAFKAAVVGDATSFDNATLWAAADEAQRRALVGSGRFGNPIDNVEIKDWSGFSDAFDRDGITYVYLHGRLLGETPTGPLPEGVHGKSLEYAASLGIEL